MDDSRPLVLMLIFANVAGVMISLIFKSYQDRMRSRNSVENIKSHSSLRIFTRNRQVETDEPQRVKTKNVSPLTKKSERSPPVREARSPPVHEILSLHGREARSLPVHEMQPHGREERSPVQSTSAREGQSPPVRQIQSSPALEGRSPPVRKTQSSPVQEAKVQPTRRLQPQPSRGPQPPPLKEQASTSARTPPVREKEKKISQRKRNAQKPAVREESLMMTPNAFRSLPDENATNQEEPQGFFSTAMDLLHHLEPLLTKPTCPPRRSVDPMNTSRRHFYDIKEDSESTVIDDTNEDEIGGTSSRAIEEPNMRLRSKSNLGAKSSPVAASPGPATKIRPKSSPAAETRAKSSEEDKNQPETSRAQSIDGFLPKEGKTSSDLGKRSTSKEPEEIQLYKIVDGKKRQKSPSLKRKNRFSFLEPPQEKDEFFNQEKTISPVRIPSKSRLSALSDNYKNGRGTPSKTFEQIGSPKTERIKSPPVETQPIFYKKVTSPPLKEGSPSSLRKSPDPRKSIESFNVEGLGRKGESKHPSVLSDTSLRDLSSRHSAEKLNDLNKKYFEKDDDYKFVSTTITRPPEFLEMEEKTNYPDSSGKRNADSPELRCCRGWAISKDKFFNCCRSRPKIKEVKKTENLIKYDVIKPIPTLVQSNQVNEETPKAMVKEEDRTVNFKQN